MIELLVKMGLDGIIKENYNIFLNMQIYIIN